MLNTENRGQVGIGTLIVFIAMVLVAAIAAGVLINTAGLLQAQAQQTGQETTSEVSDLIQVGKIVGYEYKDDLDQTSLEGNQKIEVLNASFRLAAGSDAINLSKASYTLSSGSNATVI
ncbi:MAG: archaeal flagellin N-terminal-like domain protein, partial [Halonotius sp. J07HN4]